MVIRGVELLFGEEGIRKVLPANAALLIARTCMALDSRLCPPAPLL